MTADDLARHKALGVAPLSIDVAGHRVFNMPPPTQGLASLIILGLYNRLGAPEAETAEYVHAIVEATKQAFRVRDNKITDPAYMAADPEEFLANSALDAMAEAIDMTAASP